MIGWSTACRSLAPIWCFLLIVMVLDQGLLGSGLLAGAPLRQAEPLKRYYSPFLDLKRNPVKDPVLLFIGPSRAANVPTSFLQGALDDAGLPLKAINLGVPGAGPAQILRGLQLAEVTTAGLPPGSRTIYLFNPMEMAWEPPEETPAPQEAEIPVHDLVNPVMRQAYKYSGLVQVAVKWPVLLPALHEAQSRRLGNVVPLIPPPRCDKPDKPNILGRNVEAIEHLMRRFGSDLSVIYAPLHPIKWRCLAAQITLVTAMIKRLAAETGATVIDNPFEAIKIAEHEFLFDHQHLLAESSNRSVAALAAAQAGGRR